MLIGVKILKISLIGCGLLSRGLPYAVLKYGNMDVLVLCNYRYSRLIIGSRAALQLGLRSDNFPVFHAVSCK